MDVLIQTSFGSTSLDDLVQFSDEQINGLAFGVVGLTREGDVAVYNTTEERYSGVPRSNVMGMRFFENVAQCMNNFMVAQRFEDEPDLDVSIDYVLTFRMRPTPVRVRLIQKAGVALHYVLIQR